MTKYEQLLEKAEQANNMAKMYAKQKNWQLATLFKNASKGYKAKA